MTSCIQWLRQGSLPNSNHTTAASSTATKLSRTPTPLQQAVALQPSQRCSYWQTLPPTTAGLRVLLVRQSTVVALGGSTGAHQRLSLLHPSCWPSHHPPDAPAHQLLLPRIVQLLQQQAPLLSLPSYAAEGAGGAEMWCSMNLATFRLGTRRARPSRSARMPCQCNCGWHGSNITNRHRATSPPRQARPGAHLSTHCSGSTTQPRCCSRRSLASLVPGLSLARYLQEGRQEAGMWGL